MTAVVEAASAKSGYDTNMFQEYSFINDLGANLLPYKMTDTLILISVFASSLASRLQYANVGGGLFPNYRPRSGAWWSRRCAPCADDVLTCDPCARRAPGIVRKGEGVGSYAVSREIVQPLTS